MAEAGPLRGSQFNKPAALIGEWGAPASLIAHPLTPDAVSPPSTPFSLVSAASLPIFPITPAGAPIDEALFTVSTLDGLLASACCLAKNPPYHPLLISQPGDCPPTCPGAG
jgi:hypothetical protein